MCDFCSTSGGHWVSIATRKICRGCLGSFTSSQLNELLSSSTQIKKTGK